jgi:biopolymer transport protein TolQ
MIHVLGLATPAPTLDPVDLVLGAGWVVKLVMLMLAGFSVASWYIIGFKLWALRRAEKESESFLDSFWQSKRLDAIYQTCEALRHSPVSQVFKAGYVELSKIKGAAEGAGEALRDRAEDIENVERALYRAETSEITRIESMVPFLATVGSTAPFVGLFGTVWGIMNSFIGISAERQATLAVVAPGIAEALIATAIGLVAAIPAVIAYNYFLRRTRVLQSELDTFKADYLNIIRRHFFR